MFSPNIPTRCIACNRATIQVFYREGTIVCTSCGTVQTETLLCDAYWSAETIGNEADTTQGTTMDFSAVKPDENGTKTAMLHAHDKMVEIVDKDAKRIKMGEKLVTALCEAMRLPENIEEAARYRLGIVERTNIAYSLEVRATACVILACRASSSSRAIGNTMDVAFKLWNKPLDDVAKFLKMIEAYVPPDYSSMVEWYVPAMDLWERSDIKYVGLAREIVRLAIDKHVIKGHNPVAFVAAAFVIAKFAKRAPMLYRSKCGCCVVSNNPVIDYWSDNESVKLKRPGIDKALIQSVLHAMRGDVHEGTLRNALGMICSAWPRTRAFCSPQAASFVKDFVQTFDAPAVWDEFLKSRKRMLSKERVG